MTHNTIQLLVVNHVLENGVYRFARKNCYGDNGSSGIGCNQFYNLLPMAMILNQFISYNGF